MRVAVTGATGFIGRHVLRNSISSSGSKWTWQSFDPTHWRYFSLTWTRPFYTFGSGQSPTSLDEQRIRGDAPFDMSGGEQLRDFVPVEEMARYLAGLALQQADHRIANICSGRAQSIRHLGEQWAAEMHSEIRLDLGH
jgi:nucleoside-diphosphate-sugar epimerase